MPAIFVRLLGFSLVFAGLAALPLWAGQPGSQEQNEILPGKAVCPFFCPTAEGPCCRECPVDRSTPIFGLLKSLPWPTFSVEVEVVEGTGLAGEKCVEQCACKKAVAASARAKASDGCACEDCRCAAGDTSRCRCKNCGCGKTEGKGSRTKEARTAGPPAEESPAVRELADLHRSQPSLYEKSVWGDVGRDDARIFVEILKQMESADAVPPAPWSDCERRYESVISAPLPAPREEEAVGTLRAIGRELDQLASDLEDQHHYAAADRLRAIAHHARSQAREIAAPAVPVRRVFRSR